MHTPTRLAHTLTVLLVALSGCGSEPLPKVGRNRCHADGLCITSATKHLLSGGYRRNGREVGFDSVDRGRTFSETVMGGSPTCERITLDTGHVISRSTGGKCPREWTSPEADNAPDDAEMPHYMTLLREMNSAMRAHGAPSGWTDSWKKLLFHLEGFSQEPPPADAPADVAAETVGTDISAQTLRAETAGAYASAADVYEPEAAVPTAPAMDDDETSIEGSAYFEAASRGGSSSNASPFHDHGNAPETTPARVYKVPGYEFRQVLHLFSQNIRSGLIAGWKTKAHHTATVADVYRRPKGSAQRWVHHHREVTRNHGAEPGYSDMERYATCDNLPITREEFIVGGECTGNWFINHLCNDDTALQIYHAHGAWQGGSHCLGRKRFHKPFCDKPW